MAATAQTVKIGTVAVSRGEMIHTACFPWPCAAEHPAARFPVSKEKPDNLRTRRQPPPSPIQAIVPSDDGPYGNRSRSQTSVEFGF